MSTIQDEIKYVFVINSVLVYNFEIFIVVYAYRPWWVKHALKSLLFYLPFILGVFGAVIKN